MTVRIRRSVYSLTDDTLDWYRRAVEIMRGRDPNDPTSWVFQAAIHGTDPATAGSLSNRNARYRDRCQHQTWFFLPWHRAFLSAFETIVAQTIADDGGPTDWALPYWDYSEDLASNPEARNLPPAFRSRTMPDGSFNWLFGLRMEPADGDFGITAQHVDLGALSTGTFANSPDDTITGFGGPETLFQHGGGPNGALENVPHNVIHVRIGQGGGWMINPNQAALDPIFWLHHCNIDRLWEVWRNANPLHTAPASMIWQSGQPFWLFTDDTNVWTVTSGKLLDTTTILGGYQYDGMPPATEPDAPEGVAMAAADPDLAGRTTDPVTLEATTEAQVRLDRSVALVPETEAPGAPMRQVILQLENVTGSGLPSDYDVLVDLPGDGEPPISVGILSTFGIARASDPSGAHGGSGFSQSFDITAVAARLGLARGDVERIRVTFQRQDAMAPSLPDLPAELAATPAAPSAEARVTVGRINLFFR